MLSLEGEAEVERVVDGVVTGVDLEERMVGDVTENVIMGLDSRIVLEGPDGSVVTIEELTVLTVQRINNPNPDISVRTRLWMKAGGITAEVGPVGGIRNDFSVCTPTPMCGVRGIRQTGSNADTPTPTSSAPPTG